MFEIVLFPVDQSREAIETSRKALDLAKTHNSRMILLSVVQPEREAMNDPQAVSELLDRARSQVVEHGVPCEIIEHEGNPAFVICDVADELNVDVIVMGTRGVNIEGDSESTAAKVIQLSPCPVLVVP